jgi:hypothetical protein
MAESVKVLPEAYQKMIDVFEWDLRTIEGVTRFRQIGARSLPSIAMDGTVIFSSIIPGQEVLAKEVELRFREKNHGLQNK